MSITLFVAVSITETIPSQEFVTYAFFPLGVTATPSGQGPTFTLLITVPVATSITETLNPLVTYTNGHVDETLF